MLHNINRRSLMAGGALGGLAAAAAAIPAVGLATSARANPDEDAELRNLWSKYLEALVAMRAAQDVLRPARKPYEEEFNALKIEPRYDRAFGALHSALWEKHGLKPLADAVQREHRKLLRVVKAIPKTKAESLFGIGVKLSVWEDWDHIGEEEFVEVVDAVRRDLAALTGEDFIGATGPLIEEV